MIYISSLIGSLVVFFVELFAKKVNKKQINSFKKTNEELNDTMVERYGDKIKGLPIIHQKTAVVFKDINEEEKERLRNNLVNIIRKNDSKPEVIIGVIVLSGFIRIGIIFTLLLYFRTDPIFTLSVLALLMVSINLLINKRLILAIIFLIVGAFIFPKIPGTIILFILFNNIGNILIKKVGKENN